MNFEIVTDSSANLPDELIAQYGLNILSLFYRMNDTVYKSYISGEKNDLTEFYRGLRAKEPVTTSAISPDEAKALFCSLLDAGKDILYIGFSSGLSATYQTASIVLSQLQLDFPKRKIFMVDTLSASLGQGLLVTYAAKQRAEGKSIEQVCAWLEENKLHLCHWFTVDDLFFLKRGGRISATSAIVGTVLNIKPVMHMDNCGKLVPVDTAPGRKSSLNALASQMEKTAVRPEQQTVYISHADCADDALYLAEKIKQKLPVKDVMIHLIEPVIGAHCGPDTVALYYLGTER